jgi:hypothetical protein
LIAVKKEIARSVRVDVDESGGDAAPARQRTVGRAVGSEDRGDAAAFNRNATEGRRAVARCDESRSDYRIQLRCS